MSLSSICVVSNALRLNLINFNSKKEKKMKVVVLIANGSEEIEALTPVDVLRRTGATCELISVNEKTVTCSHNVLVTADKTIEEIIEKYGVESLTQNTIFHYGFAYKYALGGDRKMFQKHIERAWETSDSNQDTTNILFTEYKSYKLLGDFEKSLQVYEQVFKREDQHVRAILNSPLMEERTAYLDKANNERKMIIRNQKLTIHVIILSCLAVIFAAGFLVLLIRIQLKKRTI